jgi:alpha-tubulin suppressor-like RCC1 family protein
MKIDYTPKLCVFNPELLDTSKVIELACGRAHYVIVDSDNNLHTYGKLFKQKAEHEHEGFEVHDGDELFDGGKVKQLSMDYEIFGALVQDK